MANRALQYISQKDRVTAGDIASIKSGLGDGGSTHPLCHSGHAYPRRVFPNKREACLSLERRSRDVEFYSAGNTRRGCGRQCLATRSTRGLPPNKTLMASPASEERLDAGLGTTQDQRMDILRTFVSVDHFQVLHVTHHRILIRDTVAAQHVAGFARYVQSLQT